MVIEASGFVIFVITLMFIIEWVTKPYWEGGNDGNGNS